MQQQVLPKTNPSHEGPLHNILKLLHTTQSPVEINSVTSTFFTKSKNSTQSTRSGKTIEDGPTLLVILPSPEPNNSLICKTKKTLNNSRKGDLSTRPFVFDSVREERIIASIAWGAKFLTA